MHVNNSFINTQELDAETSLLVARAKQPIRETLAAGDSDTADTKLGFLERLPQYPLAIAEEEKLNSREVTALKSILGRLLALNPNEKGPDEVIGAIKLACLETNQEAHRRRDRARDFHAQSNQAAA